ncbi:spore coat protein CotH [Paenibacillus sp. FSL H8-0548]|uniref:CotH kinase family protein n=1 Tax=Paenibacillus sp. FSL H8-0548 TaxID=1920422 RepID=UPI00096BE985|nr:CotH kinase family protein [Paenibacillus sp. FSL H8-0548]OMF35970.1 spore coat protein CotH [Paenibacillus sp. FSL H8-0548]
MATENLPLRTISIDSADFEELQQNAWGREFKSAELELDGQTFQAKFGLRGGHTRNYSKKSYEVRIEGGKTLHWNAEYDDPSMMRNALSFYFFNKIGVPSPETDHFWLVINGVPQGVYLEIEAVDQLFFKKRDIGYLSLLYAVNDNADFSLTDPVSKDKKSSLFDGYELMKGKTGTKSRLASFVRNLNRTSGKNLAVHTARRLDISQYLLWLAGAVLTGNYDGFDQNYALYEHSTSGKYRIIPWDYEGTWGRNCYGKPCGSDLVRLQGYNKLTEKLFTFPACRRKYRTILRKQLQSTFTTEKLEPVISKMHARLSPAIRGDYTRKASYDSFLTEPAFIYNYIKERREILQHSLREWV